MLSRTITQVMPQREELLLELQLRPELQPPPKPKTHSEEVKTLLNTINATILTLPHEHQEMVSQRISEWEEEFFANYDIDSPVDEERQKAASSLLILSIANIEYDLFSYAEGLVEQAKWISFAVDIEKIVASLLPEQVDAEAFIKEKKAILKEFASRARRIKEIQSNLSQQSEETIALEGELYDHANQVNQDLEKQYQEMITFFDDLNTAESAAIDQLHKCFDETTQRVNKAYYATAPALSEMQETAQDYLRANETFMNLLSQADDAAAALGNK